MTISLATNLTPGGTIVPLKDTLDKTEAVLNTLSASYDDKHGFIGSCKSVWLTILAVRDMVETARASLATTA